jgi:hypothetical protein
MSEAPCGPAADGAGITACGEMSTAAVDNIVGKPLDNGAAPAATAARVALPLF